MWICRSDSCESTVGLLALHWTYASPIASSSTLTVYVYNSSCGIATSTTLVSLLSLLSPVSPFFAFISPFSFCSVLSKIHLKEKHPSSPHSPHSSFLALNDPRPAPFLVARFTAVLTPTNQNKHQVASISFVHTAWRVHAASLALSAASCQLLAELG